MKPKQGEPVLIILKDGSMHEGHWLKNANYREKNVNRWRIYKTGKTVSDEDVKAWIYVNEAQALLKVGREFHLHRNKEEDHG